MSEVINVEAERSQVLGFKGFRRRVGKILSCFGLKSGYRRAYLIEECRMDGCMAGWTDGRMDGWDGRTDGRTDGRMDGWVNGWMNG